MSTDAEASELIELHEAREILGCSASTVHRLRRHGHLGVKVFPGGRARYVRADIERIARESIRPARQTVGA